MFLALAGASSVGHQQDTILQPADGFMMMG
jgi:hypothetical protein